MTNPVVPFEHVQRALAVPLTGQRVGQVAADSGHQAGPQQEVPGLGWLAGCDLAQEVVSNRTFRPAELGRPCTRALKEHSGRRNPAAQPSVRSSS